MVVFSTCISLAVVNMARNNAWIHREVFGFIIEHGSHSRKNILVVKLVYNAVILSYHGSRNCVHPFIETSFESKAAFISSIWGGYNRYGSWINGSKINVSHNAYDAVAHFSLSPNVSFEKSRAFWEVEKEKRKREKKKNMNRSFLCRRKKATFFPVKFL